MKPGTRVKLFRSWTVDDRVARRLKGTCFHRFIGFPLYLQKHMFLEQIARSYVKKEHTFVVDKGKIHLYLGLEDVYCLSGLPVDGRPIVGEDPNPTSLCRRLLDGKDDPERKPTSGVLRCSWLKKTFELVPQGLENEELDVYVRAYVLFIIGTMLLSDSDNDSVAIRYLPFIENLDPNSLNSYAWGAAVLARIHRSLQETKKSIRGASWILELFFLERVPSVGKAYLKEQKELPKKFPAFVEWSHLLCNNQRMTIDWQHVFDNIQAEEIKWTPYERFYGIDKQRIFYSRTILFDFEKIIYHMPEKAPLQLSIISMQEPSHAIINLAIKYRNGQINLKLPHHYEPYIKEWCEHRHDAKSCVIDTHQDFVLPDPPSEMCCAFDDSEGRAISMPGLTREQLSVERPDSKEVRQKQWKKDRSALKRNSFKKRKTQDISKGPEGESSRKKSLRKSIAQRSKKATNTVDQYSGHDLEDPISVVPLLIEMGSNCEDDVERNDDGHSTGGGDDYIPRDVAQPYSHPENETHACLSNQASAEENCQQTLSNKEYIKRSYLYLSSYTDTLHDTLQRFEKLVADHEELVHANNITEWLKEEYRKSFSSTSRKLERMRVEKEEVVEMLEQQLQDEMERNKQQELQLKSQGKDLEEKDIEISRLKEELHVSLIRASNQEKEKQDIMRDLASLVNRLRKD